MYSLKKFATYQKVNISFRPDRLELAANVGTSEENQQI